MKALLLRIWRSRLSTVVLVAIIAFWGVFLARAFLPGIRLGGPRMAPLVQPKTDGVEPGILAHIRQVRESLAAVEKNRSATGTDRAAAYGELGKVFLTYGFAPAAVPCFRNAAALDPDDFQWPYFLAHSLNRDSDVAEAATSMASAIERMERHPGPPFARAAALCFVGEAAVRLNKPEDAKRAFSEVLQRAPKSVFALFKMGQLASRAGDAQEAISYFERAGALAPRRPEIRQALAAEYRRHGDTQKAEAVPVPETSARKPRPLRYPDPILASLQNLNQSSSRLVRLGRQKAASGRWSEALSLFEKAVAADPGNVPARSSHGLALTVMGRVDEGRREFEEALRRNPKAHAARRALCLALAAAPATRARALEEAQRLRQEDSEREEVLQVVAIVYARSDRYAEALEAYREAIKEAPDEVWPYTGAASMLAALGRHPEARAGLEQAVARFSGNPGLRLVLARLLATSPDPRTRDPKRSVDIGRELMKSAPSAIRMETLAVALAADGKYEPAIRLQRQAVAASKGIAGAEVEGRAAAVLSSLESHKPWREPWPFRMLELSSPEE